VLIPRPGALPSDSGIRDGSAGALSLILVRNLGTIMNGWSYSLQGGRDQNRQLADEQGVWQAKKQILQSRVTGKIPITDSYPSLATKTVSYPLPEISI